MICQNCGNRLSKSDKVCPGCGASDIKNNKKGVHRHRKAAIICSIAAAIILAVAVILYINLKGKNDNPEEEIEEALNIFLEACQNKDIEKAIDVLHPDEYPYRQYVISNADECFQEVEELFGSDLSDVRYVSSDRKDADKLKNILYFLNGFDIEEVRSVVVLIDENRQDTIRIAAYKYHGKWYILPVDYKVYFRIFDAAAAREIRTALVDAMDNKDVYDVMHDLSSEEVFEFNDGLQGLPQVAIDEIMQNLGNKVPEINYIDNGACGFAFSLNEDMEFEVYICTESNPTAWEITPDTAPEYKY